VTSVYISIGNSDDKLPQAEWHRYCQETVDMVEDVATRIYGVWFSESSSEYQNMCIAAEFDERHIGSVKENLHAIRQHFRQDSAAWAEVPETEFI